MIKGLILCCSLLAVPVLTQAAILIGNTQGSIVLTEFYDYQCPHCHRMSPVIDNLIKQNQDLTVALRPVGVLNATSVVQAGLAIVSAMKTPYFIAYHRLLMQSPPMDVSALAHLAKKMNLTTPEAKTALLSKPVQEELTDNLRILQQLLVETGAGSNQIQIPVITLARKDKPNTKVLLIGEVPLMRVQNEINSLKEGEI